MIISLKDVDFKKCEFNFVFLKIVGVMFYQSDLLVKESVYLGMLITLPKIDSFKTGLP
jgi:hypothetical protein